MDKELEVGRRLAREAGSILMSFYKGDAKVESIQVPASPSAKFRVKSVRDKTT